MSGRGYSFFESTRSQFSVPSGRRTGRPLIEGLSLTADATGHRRGQVEGRGCRRGYSPDIVGPWDPDSVLRTKGLWGTGKNKGTSYDDPLEPEDGEGKWGSEVRGQRVGKERR